MTLLGARTLMLDAKAARTFIIETHKFSQKKLWSLFRISLAYLFFREKKRIILCRRKIQSSKDSDP